MAFQFPFVAIPLALTVLFCLFTGLYLWKNTVGSESRSALTTANYAQMHVLFMLAFLSGGQLVAVTSTTKPTIGLGIYLGLLGATWAGPGWLLFGLYYTGRESLLTTLRRRLVYVSPIILTLATMTGGLHGQVITDPMLVEQNALTVLDFEWGIVTWAIAIQTWVCSAFAVRFLLTKFLTARNVYRKISFFHIFGAVLLNICAFISLIGASPFEYLVLGSALFSVVILLSAPTVVTYQYLQLIPLDPILSVFGRWVQNLEPMARDTIIQNMQSGVLVVDHKNRIADINPLGRRMIEATDQRVVGKPLTEVVPPEVFQTDDTGFLESTTVDERYRGVWTNHPDGEPRCFDIQVTALGSKESPAGRVALINDVTDREIRKEKLQQRTAELERQNEQLEQFAGIVSHDLRNPLTVAKGYLENAKDVEDDEAMLEETEASLDRMEAIIQDVLTLAREGQTIGATDDVQIDSVALSAWENVDTPEVTLVVADAGSIEADRDRLLNLFENLFRNAVEHAGPGTSVTVGALENGFYVADDGPGIPESEREEVTSFGYTTSQSGTGFGLAIVNQVADAHGWEVTVTESANGGAQFEFSDVDLSPVERPTDAPAE